MCAGYWNLDTKVTCPNCGHKSVMNLQTHFRGYGDGTECTDFYKLGDIIPEFKGEDITLDGSNDYFIGLCSKCDKGYDYGAQITNGAVVRVWPLPEDEFLRYAKEIRKED